MKGLDTGPVILIPAVQDGNNWTGINQDTPHLSLPKFFK